MIASSLAIDLPESHYVKSFLEIIKHCGLRGMERVFMSYPFLHIIKGYQDAPEYHNIYGDGNDKKKDVNRRTASTQLYQWYLKTQPLS
jgi:hypothetical protein